MQRDCFVGQHVIFTDSFCVKHDALVTAWHLGEPKNTTLEDFKNAYGENAMPCVNLLYVSKDPKKNDPYGNQIERLTSVAHKSVSWAVNGAMTYCWPDEE